RWGGTKTTRCRSAKHCVTHSASRADLAFIQFVGNFEPVFHVRIDLFELSDRNPMRNAVAFLLTARVDQACGHLAVELRQSQPEVDARFCRGFDLRKYVMAIERDDCLARAGFDVFA